MAYGLDMTIVSGGYKGSMEQLIFDGPHFVANMGSDSTKKQM